MILILDSILSDAELKTLRDTLSTREGFQSGKATAGWAAKPVKNNLQTRAGARSDGLKRIVEAALMKHEVFKAAAQPKRIVRTVFSRYEAGMAYGTHIDDAMMAGARTDLSFTLFLNPPEDYQGGELVIESPEGEADIKLQAGQAVLYPTQRLHHVAEVTSGARLAAVGWVRSLVRSAEQREMLFDLSQTVQQLRNIEGANDALLKVLKTKANLLRMWGDD